MTKAQCFDSIKAEQKNLQNQKKRTGQPGGSSTQNVAQCIKQDINSNTIQSRHPQGQPRGWLFKRGLDRRKTQAFSRNPTEKRAERRARIEAVATKRNGKNKQHKQEASAPRLRGTKRPGENKMKKKARTTLIIAGLIMAILLAGKIDNDTAEQKNQPRQNCTWITTPDGAGSCR